MKKFNAKKFYSLMIVSVLLIGGIFVNTEKVSASNATLSSKDFVVWNQGELKGYDVAIKIEGDTFNNASSIIVKLYSGDTLLQTNIATSGKITGAEFLTPFDVLGTFNYSNDGYFINIKEAEYGKTLTPTKIIATVTLNDGTLLTTTNTNLTGNTSLIVGSSGKVLGANKFNFTKPLKVGSKGDEVTELQKFLNDSGHNSGNADGYFGNKTKAAVMKLQTANKLKADGIVGPATRLILNK